MNKRVKEKEIKELALLLAGKVFDAHGVAKSLIEDLGYRKQSATVEEFIMRFNHNIRDLQVTLGQTNDIMYALKKSKEEMI